MKRLISLGILFILSGQANAQFKTTCIALNYLKYRKTVKANTTWDKQQHCAMTCLLTLSCGKFAAINSGICKEALDLITPGDCDLEDIKANLLGASVAKKNKDKKKCLPQCRKILPRP